MTTVIAKIPSMRGPLAFETTMKYDTADPYAVHIRFGASPWVIGRELLSRGLVTRAGIGDVTIGADREILGIRLSSRKGESADLTMPRWLVEKFVQETLDMVPIGSEHEFMDMDAELAELLA